MANPALLILLAACDSQPATVAPPVVEEPKASGPSLVLVTLDTTRADRIGAYGHQSAHTPVIDRFATEGARFDHAYAAVPLTTPSHATMLTGLYPPRHGIHSNGDAIASDQLTTLAEVLHDHGYHTAASVSAFVTTRIWNLDQGFDAYFDDVGAGAGRWTRERPATPVVDDLVKWLGEQPDGEPFFVWAHFYDPHAPHTAPKAFLEAADDAYDAEIAYVDSQIGRLREAVDAKAGDAGAAWILVADHGEALDREHSEFSHGLFLYEPTTHIPFIARPAHPLTQPLTVADRTVSGVDVMPTALGLVGLQGPDGLDGMDLSPIVRGEPAPSRAPVYMESEGVQQRFGYAPELAAVTDGYKLMDTPSPRLFNLSDDPGETTNLAGTLPEIEAPLRQTTRSIHAQKPDFAVDAPAPGVFDQLAALGYVAPITETDASSVPTIDAKDRIATIEAIQQAQAMGQSGKYAEAAKAWKEIIAKEPQIAEGRLGLAQSLGSLGHPEQAERVLRDALERDPSSVTLKLNLANNLAAQGRFEDGLALMQSAHDQVPEDDSVRVGMLKMLMDLQRPADAQAKAEDWLVDNPDNPTLLAYLGVAMARQDKLEAAVPYLQKSTQDGVPRQLVHWYLGQAAAKAGKPNKALFHFRRESAFFPGDSDVRRAIADLLMSTRRWDEAAAEYAFIANLKKKDWDARRAWAQAVFNSGDYERAAEILAPSLKNAPKDPQVLLLHANLLDKQGKHDEGAKVFKQAKALFEAQKQQAAEATATQ